MKLKKKTLLYDVASIAYTIADTKEACHALHNVRDICQEGNIDRVSRILGLAYSQLLALLMPILQSPKLNPDHDNSMVPHDYEFCFRNDSCMKFRLTGELRLLIKETAHEYMVAMVLSDWLDITLPEAADVWKCKAETALESLKDILLEVTAGSRSAAFSRNVSPF